MSKKIAGRNLPWGGMLEYPDLFEQGWSKFDDLEPRKVDRVPPTLLFSSDLQFET
jgi:hypothetical protein